MLTALCNKDIHNIFVSCTVSYDGVIYIEDDSHQPSTPKFSKLEVERKATVILTNGSFH